MRVELHQMVWRLPAEIRDASGHEDGEKVLRKPIKGEVTYIHPEDRFHMVTFHLRGGDIRQCFKGVEV